jgi:hypothetical protein
MATGRRDMTELERRYRRVLRLLPGPYRQAWEEDMVATFLAGAVPADPEAAAFVTDYGRPDWSEVVSVVGLAVRLRLGGADAPPRYLAWGNAVRLVALVGLLVHAVNALAGVGALLWLPERFPAVAMPSGTVTVLALLGLSWVAAYLALVGGHLRAARLVAALSLAPAVISVGMEVAITGTDYLASRVVELAVAAMPVLALAAFHREAAPVRPRPWLIALPIGAVVVTSVLLATQFPGGAVFVDWPGLACVAVLVAALVHRRGPSWTAAIALFAGATFVLRAVTLLDYLAAGQDTLITVALAEGAAVVLVGVPLAVRAIRMLRDLPAAAGYPQATTPPPDAVGGTR